MFIEIEGYGKCRVLGTKATDKIKTAHLADNQDVKYHFPKGMYGPCYAIIRAFIGYYAIKL